MNRCLYEPPPFLRSSSIFQNLWTISIVYILAGHFKEEPGICGGGPVIGERTPETVAKVVGERGNELEGVGGVAKAEEERAENGKKESEDIVDVVVMGGECGEVGELGIEI